MSEAFDKSFNGNFPFETAELNEIRIKQSQLVKLVPAAFLQEVRRGAEQVGERVISDLDGLIELRVRQVANDLFEGDSGLKELFERFEEKILRDNIPSAINAFLGEDVAIHEQHRLNVVLKLAFAPDNPYPKLGISNLLEFVSAIDFANYLAGSRPDQ